MNGLCRWMLREAMSAATERSSSIRKCLDDESRQNRVLSPFCGQQKISWMGGSGLCRFSMSFRCGLFRNASGSLPLAPHPPPCKTGFWGWRENPAAPFSGYFFQQSTIFYIMNANISRAKFPLNFSPGNFVIVQVIDFIAYTLYEIK
ncbi:hypothetical protein FBQ90_07845 [Betaproteobacteria bacterium PRO5]|nr:hypothetical protein [Betaproteobacteria bacterium PRO5]